MADQDVTKNFFENPMGNGSTGLSAGVGGLIGAALGQGNGLFGGNNRETATLDQVDSRFNALQSQLAADQVEDRIAGVTSAVNSLGSHLGLAVGGSTAAISAELGSIKDALNCNNSALQLALCGIGHNITAGNAAVVSQIQAGFASSERLALQQALDAERSRATELRIELSETRNQAGHTATQVLLNQVISAK